MGDADPTVMAALWGGVIFTGLYHGVNPGMGWPLAVSATLMEGRSSSMARALVALGVGHFLSMTAILLPFSLMALLWAVAVVPDIRIGAGALVVAMGVYLLANQRHPRFLARVPPTRLALWSFLAALTHGAGLMLVPIYLGICGLDADSGGHEAARALMGRNIFTAFIVALVHTAAMTLAGGLLALGVYLWLGLRFLKQTWFNLDIVWALSLVAVGGAGIHAAIYGH